MSVLALSGPTPAAWRELSLMFGLTPGRNGVAAQTFFDHIFDVLGNARVALHQRGQVVRVEHKQIGTGQRDDCRG